MPIKDSAKKYLRASRKRGKFNQKTKDEVKIATKNFLEKIKAGDKKESANIFKNVQKALDKAVKKGVIKKNTAARRKSTLAKKNKALN